MTIAEREAFTNERIQAFGAQLRERLGGDFDKCIGAHSCVYVTGSAGRGEMGVASDIDPFIARVTGAPSRLNDVVLQACLVRANDALDLPELDADGAFLVTHQLKDFQSLLGDPKDDYENKLTPRMLLLLESKPVLGKGAYGQLVEGVVEAYWLNASEHEHNYLPYVLVNDIVRYWRIVLLNHEAKLRKKKTELNADALRIERRYRSYKLRFPRCLSCFATLAWLLDRTRGGSAHVERDDVVEMTSRTPLQRLSDIHADGAATYVSKLHSLYESYLDTSADGKRELKRRMVDDSTLGDTMSARGTEFTKTMFELLQHLGSDDNPLYVRLIV